LKVALQTLVRVRVSWNRLLDSRERRVVPQFIMGRRFAHYGACCGVKPFSVKTEGKPQGNSNKSSRHAVGFCV